MRKIRVAQIGIGHDHAPWVLQSIRKQKDIFDVAGIVLPAGEQEKFPHWVAYYEGLPQLQLEQVLADDTIEAVIIESEEVNLTALALACARAGKQIHMDKPGGMSLREFEQLIDTVRENQLVFHTGYMYRYNPEVARLLRRVKDGELGRIISVEAQMNCFHTPQKRQWLENFPGGMMFFLGCHLIDLILQIQGLPKGVLPLNCSTGADGVTARDYGMAVLAYENGISFAKTNAAERGGFLRRQLVVTGEKETVELKPLETVADYPLHYTDCVACRDADWHKPGQASRCVPYDRYDDMMASFAAMVRGEKENPWSYDYELTLYKTLLRCCGVEV